MFYSSDIYTHLVKMTKQRVTAKEGMTKGLFTPSENGSEREKDQKTRGKNQRINDKHHSKFLLRVRFRLV